MAAATESASREIRRQLSRNWRVAAAYGALAANGRMMRGCRLRLPVPGNALASGFRLRPKLRRTAVALAEAG